jgi:hypothetical protein
MGEAPLAPKCRHCDATNDSGASECWLCQRRDWREPPTVGSKDSPSRSRGSPRAQFMGCMVVVTIALITMVGLSFRAGRIVGLAVSILGALFFALAIALFTICMAIA